MKLSERMRNMALSWVTPYEQDGFDLIDEVAQLEAENAAIKRAIAEVRKSDNERNYAYGQVDWSPIDALLTEEFTGGTTPTYFSAQDKE